MRPPAIGVANKQAAGHELRRERAPWPACRAQQRWCEMRRTLSFFLAFAGVISGRTSASGRLYVLGSRRLGGAKSQFIR